MRARLLRLGSIVARVARALARWAGPSDVGHGTGCRCESCLDARWWGEAW